MCYPAIIRRNRKGDDVNFGELGCYSIPGLDDVTVLVHRLHGIRILGLDDQGPCGDKNFLTDLHLSVHTPVSMGVRITNVYLQNKDHLSQIAHTLSLRNDGQVVKVMGQDQVLAVWGNGALIDGPHTIDKFLSESTEEEIEYYSFEI